MVQGPLGRGTARHCGLGGWLLSTPRRSHQAVERASRVQRAATRPRQAAAGCGLRFSFRVPRSRTAAEIALSGRGIGRTPRWQLFPLAPPALHPRPSPQVPRHHRGGQAAAALLHQEGARAARGGQPLPAALLGVELVDALVRDVAAACAKRPSCEAHSSPPRPPQRTMPASWLVSTPRRRRRTV